MVKEIGYLKRAAVDKEVTFQHRSWNLSSQVINSRRLQICTSKVHSSNKEDPPAD
jgi:hypothetical protein